MKKIILTVLLTLTLVLAGCSARNTIEDTNIVVAASATPHALILEQAREYIEARGYTLEIRIVNDYVIPNNITQTGEADANFFQHVPYLEDFNVKNQTTLVSVLPVHFEPLGLYIGKRTSLTELQGAQIGIPNDRSNGARALLLLQQEGIIELDPSKGIGVTKNDITSNPHQINIVELEAAAIPAALADLDFAIINGNYALSSNIAIDRIVAQEDKDSISAQTYANIIAVKEGNQNAAAIELLIEALSQSNIAEYINNQFQTLVVPMLP